MNRLLNRPDAFALSSLIVFAIIFYVMAYGSVSSYPPNAIPVHHDDYTNYSAGLVPFSWTWNRPFSQYVIHVLGMIGSDALIWVVRILSVSFVFLCWTAFFQLQQSTTSLSKWSAMLAFGIASMSTPFIVDYARYTGMITHLLSGCLGMGAVVAQFKGVSRPASALKYLFLSAVLIVLSVAAKEDFFLFFIISTLYTLLRWPLHRRTVACVTLIACGICFASIALSKFNASSSFLGVSDIDSTYYVNFSLQSVVSTVWRYLAGQTNGGNPLHGIFWLSLFILSGLGSLTMAIFQRRIPVSAYFFTATLTLIAPYSVLPNHTNPYYEPVWLPMLIATLFSFIIEICAVCIQRTPLLRRSIAASILMLFSAAITSSIDFPSRKSVAHWYDEREIANAQTLSTLEKNRTQINQIKRVCIRGADTFSPWFMHNGDYLKKVMDLDAIWYVVSTPATVGHDGMIVSTIQPGKHVRVISEAEIGATNCYLIDL